MRIVSTLLFIVCFILGYIFLGQNVEHEIQPASFLPVDTILYAEQYGGTEAISKYNKSRIGIALSSINYSQGLNDAGVPVRTIAVLEEILGTITSLQNNRLVHEILGKHCSVALFPKRDWSINTTTLKEYLEAHSVFISKPRIRTSALNTLIDSYSGDYTVSSVPFGKYSIKRIQIDHRTLAILFTEGYMLASFEERVLRESLQVFTSGGNSLAVDVNFQKLSESLMNAERKVYLAIDRLQKLAVYGAERTAETKIQAILNEFSGLKGLTSLGYGAWRDGDTARDEFFVTFDKASMDARVMEMISTKAAINDTLPFVAGDALLYYWSNTLNIRLLWEMYVDEAGPDDADVAKIRTLIRNFSGYELEGLIEMVDSSVGILLRQSPRKQFVPIPDLAVMLKLNDPEKIAEVLRQGLLELDINIQGRNYRNVKYFYWGLYPQESLQPVYTIYRDYLIIANTFDILKAIIDTPVNNSRLVGSDGFAKLDPGFQNLNNSVCYVNQGVLLSHIKELISWSGTFLAIQDREAAENSKLLIENLIDPLFYGMAMYNRSATRTYIEDNLIMIKSRTEITQ